METKEFYDIHLYLVYTFGHDRFSFSRYKYKWRLKFPRSRILHSESISRQLNKMCV